MPDWTSRILNWWATGAGRVVSLILVSAVAVWFTLPAFSVAYSEGFQPEIVINAHAFRSNDPDAANALYPFNRQFFLLTRLGTTLGMLGLQHIGDLNGLAAFRIIGVTSLAVLVGTLLTLLWRVYRVHPVLGLLCCILFPPIYEATYLPNDNMPSAALIAVALLLFWTNPTVPRTVATGLLLGVAALLRLDALLVAPAFAILLLTEVPDWRARAVRAGIAAGLVAAVPIMVYWLCGLSFFDTFAAVDRGIEMWDRPNRPLYNDLRTATRSMTALGGLAWVLGIAAFVRTRRWRDLSLAVLVPLFYVVAYRAQLVENRYLLPLSPFLLLAMAEGLRSVASLPGRWRTVSVTGLAAGFALWIVPPPSILKPNVLADDEGPRFLVGRAWNPLPTLWWQGRLRAGQAVVEAQIERIAATPDPVIVTGYWNADRLVTMLLLEHGFTSKPSRTPEPCRSIAETLVRGPVVLTQIRTHIPFIREQSERVTWELAGLPCLRAIQPVARPVLLVDSVVLSGPVARLAGPEILFSGAHGPAAPLAPQFGPMLTGLVVASLPVDGVAALLKAAATPEDRQAAIGTVARRAALLR